MNNPAVSFVSALVAQLPILLIAVTGIVLARTRLRASHARARGLATAGFALTALHALAGAGIRTYVAIVTARSVDHLALANSITYMNIAAYLLLVASLVLLLLAVFADRDSRVV